MFTPNDAQACKEGTFRFNWKTMREEPCNADSKQQLQRMTYPWQEEWETCYWKEFPANTKTTGNKICGSAKWGKCKAVIREDALRPKEIYQGSDYSCNEPLQFSAAKKECIKSPFAGFPNSCREIKTKVSCCK